MNRRSCGVSVETAVTVGAGPPAVLVAPTPASDSFLAIGFSRFGQTAREWWAPLVAIVT
jgi:hypothetical protein